jgi:threonine/homoserine/homoserine lactone efflux protein
MGPELLSFVAVAALVIATPGQDTALTIRNTLSGGRRAGIATALGVSTGQALWALATAAGIAALLRASEPAFLAIRLLGAAYLVLLGVQALYAALRGRPAESAWASGTVGQIPRAAFRQGLLSNLGNPKMAVFFTSLLPQFANQGSAPFAWLLLLGLIFALATLGWLSAYAAAVARARHVLGRPAIRRAVEGVAGAVLVGLGVRVATEAGR